VYQAAVDNLKVLLEAKDYQLEEAAQQRAQWNKLKEEEKDELRAGSV
jgi:hypothetical protein